MSLSVNFKPVGCKEFSLDLRPSMTVQEMRVLVKANVPGPFRMVYKGTSSKIPTLSNSRG